MPKILNIIHTSGARNEYRKHLETRSQRSKTEKRESRIKCELIRSDNQPNYTSLPEIHKTDPTGQRSDSKLQRGESGSVL